MNNILLEETIYATLDTLYDGDGTKTLKFQALIGCYYPTPQPGFAALSSDNHHQVPQSAATAWAVNTSDNLSKMML